MVIKRQQLGEIILVALFCRENHFIQLDFRIEMEVVMRQYVLIESLDRIQLSLTGFLRGEGSFFELLRFGKIDFGTRLSP